MNYGKDAMTYIETLCKNAKETAKVASNLTTKDKNNILLAIANKLRSNKDFIISENSKDLANAKQKWGFASILRSIIIGQQKD